MDSDRLNAIPVFASLGDQTLRSIATFATDTSVPAGKHLVNEGDYAVHGVRRLDDARSPRDAVALEPPAGRRSARRDPRTARATKQAGCLAGMTVSS